jgi:RNA polymerase sigma-70 factor, ECF subfamily
MQVQLHYVWPHPEPGLLMAFVDRTKDTHATAEIIALRPTDRSLAAQPFEAPAVGESSTSDPAHVSRGAKNQPVDAVLEELLREHLSSMFRLAKSIVRDAALAEDVVQESLLKAWQAGHSFRGESSLRSWALRITHNTAISTMRRRREDFREPARIPERQDPLGLTDRQVHGRMMVDQLWVALEQLDPVSRSITVLREVDGMSYEEIAETLELPLPTVKTRLFRARKILAAVLQDWR